MQSPYGMPLVEDCLSCKLCSPGFSCDVPKAIKEAFQRIKFTIGYPACATLFVQGQTCRRIYLLCRGCVKLSVTSSGGHTLLLKIAPPGDFLGLNAAIAEVPYETTAETGQPCQVNFVKRSDFLMFLAEHGYNSLHAAVQVGHDCQQAYDQFRSFTMNSSSQRLARLMLDWSQDGSGITAAHGIKSADPRRDRTDHRHVARDRYAHARQFSQRRPCFTSGCNPADPEHLPPFTSWRAHRPRSHRPTCFRGQIRNGHELAFAH